MSSEYENFFLSKSKRQLRDENDIKRIYTAGIINIKDYLSSRQSKFVFTQWLKLVAFSGLFRLFISNSCTGMLSAFKTWIVLGLLIEHYTCLL